jgi:hypothetical protein
MIAGLMSESFIASDREGVLMLAAGQEVEKNLGPNLLLGVRLLVDTLIENAEKNSDVEFSVEEDLVELYQYGLKIIFRAVFILASESKGICLTGGDKSEMEDLLNLLSESIVNGIEWKMNESKLWSDFQMMITEIEGKYGGSLFASERWDMLEVSDSVFSEVLILVAFNNCESNNPKSIPEKISFIEFEIEQIGGFYESLLDYQPAIAECKYVWKTKNGWPVLEKYEGEKTTDVELLEKGSFVLIPSDERHNSGTHYTPRKITTQLVEITVGEIISDLSSNEILELKICDPAMGSGAFLLQVVRFLTGEYAKKIQTELNENRFDPEKTHCSSEGQQYRWDSIEGKEKRFYSNRWQSHSPFSEKAMNDHQRLIIEHCIYGVDKNSMAVELAKASLWLLSLDKEKPFTFLDSRLKCGNSLLGARFDQLFIHEDSINDKVWSELHDQNNSYIKRLRDEKLEQLGFGKKRESDLKTKIQKTLKRLASKDQKQSKLIGNYENNEVERYKSELNEFISARKRASAELNLSANIFADGAIREFLDDFSLKRSKLLDNREDTISNLNLITKEFEEIELNSEMRIFIKELLDTTCAVWWWHEFAVGVDKQIVEPILTREIPLYSIWLAEKLGLLEEIENKYGNLPDEEKQQIGKLAPRFEKIRNVVMDCALKHNFFHWELEFPETLAIGEKKFGVFIMNPPFVNAWSSYEDDERTRDFLRSKFPEMLKHHWDLSSAFVAQSKHLSANSGMVLATGLLTQNHGEPVRLEIMNRASHFIDWTGKSWFSAAVDIMLISTSDKKLSDKGTIFQRHDGEGGLTQPTSINSVMLNADQGIQYVPDPITEFNLEKYIEISDLLGNHVQINYGAQVSSKEKGGKKKEYYIREKKSDCSSPKKYTEAKHMDFDTNPITINKSFWLEYKPDELYGPRTPEFFEQDKLVFQELCQDFPKHFVDQDHWYYNHSVVIGVLHGTLKPESNNDFGFEVKNDLTLFEIDVLIENKFTEMHYLRYLKNGMHNYPRPCRMILIPRLDDDVLADALKARTSGNRDEARAIIESAIEKRLS